MNSVVVMPTAKRPEMLALALERLSRAVDAPTDVRLFLDVSQDEKIKKIRIEETEYVRDAFYPTASITHVRPHFVVPSGMYCILMALKNGYESGKDFCFLIEEDIFIRPKEFFSWHYQAQVSGDYLATCGRKLPRLPSYDKYQNPGSCFRHEKLGLIVPHINDELFRDRSLYYRKHFVNAPELSDLDDGLIRRVAKTGGHKVLYPETAMCSHLGFLAYNRYDGYLNLGTIEQRIAGLRKLLPKVNPEARYTKDFEPPID